MTELSPQAQAVYDAVREICPAPADEIAAAALRAAADHIQFQDQLGLTAYGGHSQAQRQLLAIAAELEDDND
jgi:alkylation response protein AidB-like acyl-CoA dehydrogenase